MYKMLLDYLKRCVNIRDAVGLLRRYAGVKSATKLIKTLCLYETQAI